MEVIVNEDQLSLAIGKRGQNVRLATKLVGWNIDIRSEEELKREVTEAMGALIASGEAVPLSAIEGVTAQQAEALGEKGINDIDALAQTSIDDLVEILDLSLDEAEVILAAAKAVIAIRERSLQGDVDESTGDEAETSEAASAEDSTDQLPQETAAAGEADSDTESDEDDDPTAAGYDEAVRRGIPFSAEPEILARDSADPVPVTESEPFTEEELPLLEAGKDLRPDTITPAPDITSTSAAALQHVEELVGEELDDAAAASGFEELTTSAPETDDDAASVGGSNEEKQDASPDAAE
jgi:N utilization substance protein A